MESPTARALRDALAGRHDPGLEANLREAARELSWAREQRRLLGVYEAPDQGRGQGLKPTRRRAMLLVRNTCSHDARVLRRGEGPRAARI